MYDELIKRLRAFCKGCKLWDGCKCCLKDECSQQTNLQAADTIEELQKDLERSKDFEAFWQHEAEEALKKFQVAISDKPRWIPVTERLPEEMDRSCGGWSAEIRPSDDVLVWLSSEKRQSVAWYSHTYNEWTTVDENTVYCFGEVTHYMPLPEPPKDGES